MARSQCGTFEGRVIEGVRKKVVVEYLAWCTKLWIEIYCLPSR